ncbi:unnamed protein product [Dicrocoelium dendriticum]|nr:unnamed protein product [Dicrocoelium dendriticum]
MQNPVKQTGGMDNSEATDPIVKYSFTWDSLFQGLEIFATMCIPAANVEPIPTPETFVTGMLYDRWEKRAIAHPSLSEVEL